jgi:hypothetical protein
VIYPDAGAPQLLANVHTLLEHTSEALPAKGHDENVDLTVTQGLGVLLTLETCLGDREDTVDAE